MECNYYKCYDSDHHLDYYAACLHIKNENLIQPADITHNGYTTSN